MVAVVGTATTAAGASTGPSVAHTVAAGTNRVSYIAIVLQQDTTTISSISTFGGVTPQLVGSYFNIHVYRVVNPATGATTASAVASLSNDWTIHVITFQGVDQADPDDAIVTNTNSEIATLEATVTSAVNDLVIAVGMVIGSTIAASGGATLSTEQEAIQGSGRSAALVYEAGAASVTLGVSTGTSFGDNILLAFNVNNAGGGAASSLALKSRRYL